MRGGETVAVEADVERDAGWGPARGLVHVDPEPAHADVGKAGHVGAPKPAGGGAREVGEQRVARPHRADKGRSVGCARKVVAGDAVVVNGGAGARIALDAGV